MKRNAFGRLVKSLLRTSALALAVAAAAPALAAEHPAPAPAAATPAQSEAGPALWVVRDADSTLYLFGTMHALSPGASWNTPRVAAAVSASEEIWFELEPPGDPAAMQALVMQYGLDPAHPLSTKLTPAEFRLFSEAVTGMGMQPAQLDGMRPWLAAITLSTLPMTQAGYDPAAGADAVMLAAARQAGRRVRTFENSEQQTRFLADLPPEVELQFLREALGSFRRGPELVRQMERVWLSGDIAGLWTLGGEAMRSGFPEVYQALLAQRNRAWVERIAQELAGSGTDFVAVGALHLAGPDSVVAMLEARGYRVERQ